MKAFPWRAAAAALLLSLRAQHVSGTEHGQGLDKSGDYRDASVEDVSAEHPAEKLFDAMDLNGDGGLGMDEFTTKYLEINPNALEDEIKAIFEGADKDGSGVLGPGEASDVFYPVKEITHVKIFNAPKGSQLTKRPGRLYVEFHHGGKRRGISMPLKDVGEASWVDLPIIATEEAMMEPFVKCKIKRRRLFLPDRVIFTADVDLRYEHEATSAVRDMKGNDTGARIKLGLFTTEWVAKTSKGVNPKRNIDLYYLVAIRNLDRLAKKFFLGGTEVLKKPVQAANPDLPTIVLLDERVEFPKQDEFFPLPWEVSTLAPIGNRWLPMTDRNNLVTDRASLRNMIRTEKMKSYVFEPYEGRWVAPLSDASMTRVFFSGMGMIKTARVTDHDQHSDGNEYVADFSYLGNLTYKKRFENLACKVFFDADTNITMIEEHDGQIHRPGDEHWEYAKLKARSAAFVLVSLEHLTEYHLIWANVPGMALRKYLQPQHPVRVALTPHFMRSHQTCLQSEPLLVVERGPLHRLLPFAYKDGLEKAYSDIAEDFTFTTWPEHLESKGMLQDQHHIGATDGLDLHRVLMSYVSNLFDEIYPTAETLDADDDIHKMFDYLTEKLKWPAEFSMENLKLVWGEILFRVTGLHTNIGNAAIWALEPFMVNFRLDKDDRGIVGGSLEVLKGVGFIVGLTVPAPDSYPALVDDWTHVMHDSNSGAYAQLKANLTVLGDEIDGRNKARRFKNVEFHPDFAAISIFS